MTNIQRIGFIGLGNMGLPMAQNLAAAGHDVTGFDPASPETTLPLAQDAAVAADGADVVILMLPNGAIATSVAQAVVPIMAPGAMLIDCSTVDIESARTIHGLAAEAELDCLDAPVSGGSGGAFGGTLTFMVGGTDAAFHRASSLFDVMGSKAVHCGDASAGQAVKICNNMLLSITMIGACEAFNLGEKLGLDAQRLFDVMSTSSGNCWPVNSYCPVPGVGPQSPADRDYAPGFATDLMVKDAGLAQAAADQTATPTPLGAHAANLYGQMQREGMGEMDFSAVIQYLAKRTRNS